MRYLSYVGLFILLLLLQSCITSSIGAKNTQEDNVLYLVKYKNFGSIASDIEDRLYGGNPHAMATSAKFRHMQYASKLYPPVRFAGKIEIKNKDINFGFIDKEENNKAKKLFAEAKKNGFKTEWIYLYTTKPVKYPKNGKIYNHYGNSLYWIGKTVFSDDDFIRFFIKKFLFDEGYAQVEKEVGEKYFKLRQTDEITKGELLNATILQKDEVIYEDQGDDEYKMIKENDYTFEDFGIYHN
jgi:hypothetical protein